MFSNRSVSVQPSAPPIEIRRRARRLADRLGGREELGHVFGGFTPAFLKRLDVVPDGRLVGALEEEAVELAVDVPSCEPVRRELRSIASFAKSIGFSAPSARTRARSAGLGDQRRCPADCRPRPRSTRTVVSVLSPADVYFDCRRPGYCLVEAVDHGLEGLLLGRRSRSPMIETVAGDVACVAWPSAPRRRCDVAATQRRRRARRAPTRDTR